MPLVTGTRAGETTALSQRPARLEGQVRSLLHDVSARQPIVVAIEDLHWADQTTRELVLTLLRARGWIGPDRSRTYRSDELHRRHPLLPILAEIERSVPCERVDLTALSEADIDELAHVDPRPAVERPGRPRSLRGGAAATPSSPKRLLAAGRGDSGLPAGLRHVVLARTQALGADAVPLPRGCVHAWRSRSTGSCSRRRPSSTASITRRRWTSCAESGSWSRHPRGSGSATTWCVKCSWTSCYRASAPRWSRERPTHWSAINHSGWARSPDYVWLPAQLDAALKASIAAAEAAEAIGAMAEASEFYRRAIDIWQRVERADELASCSYLQLLRRAARAADSAREFDQAVELARTAAAAGGGGRRSVRRGQSSPRAGPVHVERKCAGSRRRHRAGARRAPCRTGVGRAGPDGDQARQPAAAAR